MSVMFGDDHPDDSYNPAPPDPEQVARRLHQLRLSAGKEQRRWDDLGSHERDVLVTIMVSLFRWLRREGGHL